MMVFDCLHDNFNFRLCLMRACAFTFAAAYLFPLRFFLFFFSSNACFVLVTYSSRGIDIVYEYMVDHEKVLVNWAKKLLPMTPTLFMHTCMHGISVLLLVFVWAFFKRSWSVKKVVTCGIVMHL